MPVNKPVTGTDELLAIESLSPVPSPKRSQKRTYGRSSGRLLKNRNSPKPSLATDNVALFKSSDPLDCLSSSTPQLKSRLPSGISEPSPKRRKLRSSLVSDPKDTENNGRDTFVDTAEVDEICTLNKADGETSARQSQRRGTGKVPEKELDLFTRRQYTSDNVAAQESSDEDGLLNPLVSQAPSPDELRNANVVKRSTTAIPEASESATCPSPSAGRISLKKVIVGETNVQSPADNLPESPSRRAQLNRSNRKNIASSRSAAPLFDDQVPVSNKTRADTLVATPDASTLDEASDIWDLATPTKSHAAREERSMKKVSSRSTSQTLPAFESTKEHAQILKHRVLAKLTQRKKLELSYRDSQYADVYALLRETIIRSESNSALLVGPRSTGKTLLVHTALQSFADDKHEFLVVYLDGNIQMDDRSALKAIAKQLQPDYEDIANADVMTALLAILSDPKEFGENESPLSTIIILEHFEKFTNLPRQTLLYNLFDIAQAKKAPICVLGLTSRIDSYDALEKRVKSRFSHRIIQFTNLQKAHFTSLAVSALTCSVNQNEAEGMADYARAWNEHVNTSENLHSYIEFIYLTSGNIRDIFAMLIPQIAILGMAGEGTGFPTFSELLPTIKALPNSKTSLLVGLSPLELSLLISATRLEIKSGRINLLTTIAEYGALVQKSTISQKLDGITTARSASKTLCRIAWQRLLDTTLLVPGRSSGARNNDFRIMQPEVRLEEVAELVTSGELRIERWMESWLTLG